MNTQTKARFSGIELLKLIAMFFIVISHSAPYYGNASAESFLNLRVSTTNIQHFFIILFVYLGQIGNCIFLSCSSHFLLEQDTVKGRKIVSLLVDCLFFSLCFLALFLSAGYDISKTTVLKQFFPTTFEYNWFVGCYLLLYLIHPALNRIIRSLSQKQLFGVNLGGILLYSLLQMVLRNSFYYTRFIGFLLIYFLMAYCKMYLKQTCSKKQHNLFILLGSVLFLIVLLILTNYFGFYLDTFREKMLHYCIFTNPFIILIAFSSFHLCKDISWRSNTINTAASVSLYIYIIHENYLFATYARPEYFAYIYTNYSYSHVALWCLILALICYFCSLLIGLLYRFTLKKLMELLCGKLYSGIENLYNQLYVLFQKWN